MCTVQEMCGQKGFPTYIRENGLLCMNFRPWSHKGISHCKHCYEKETVVVWSE